MGIIDIVKRVKDRYHLFVDENYNIGFVENFTPKKLIDHQSIGRISWLKHSYRDRFFADPFILKVSSETIEVLVEELIFDEHKGAISKLIVDRRTKRLISRQELLKIDTHLSYPAIINLDDKIYVYPENCEGGALNLYEYVPSSPPRLVYKSDIVSEPLVDSTIIVKKNSSFLIATKSPFTQSDLYLYKSNNRLDDYRCVGIVSQGHRVRPAGNFFEVDGDLYRPAQNCEKRYGASIDIMKVFLDDSSYHEELVFSILPDSYKYNLGIHTLNFKDDLCVVDGYGYLYPILGRLRKFIVTLFAYARK